MSNGAVICEASSAAAIIVKDAIISSANTAFLELTEYSNKEIIGLQINQFIVENLRSKLQIDSFINEDLYSGYIFTKSFQFREVDVIQRKGSQNGVYILIFSEIPNTRLEDNHAYVEQLSRAEYTGIAVYNIPDLILVKANQKYIDSLNPPFNNKANSIGKRLEEIIPGWKGTDIEKYWREAIATQRAIQVKEYEHIGYDRGVTYWESVIIPILKDGEVKYIISNTIEVTDKVLNRKKVHKQAEEIMRHKEHLEAIIENMSDALIVYNKDGSACLVNEEARKVMYQPDDYIRLGDTLKNTKYLDMSGKEIKLQDLPATRALNGEKIVNYIMSSHRPNGSSHYNASASPVYNEKGEVEYAVVMMRDITEQIKKDEVIKAQKEQLEAVVHSMSDGLEIVDDKLKITFLNQAARDFFYHPDAKVYAGDSLMYNKYYYGIDGIEIPRQDLPALRIYNEGRFQNYILTIERPDKKLYASVNGSPIYDKDGSFKSAILCLRDITEQVKQEERLQLNQQYALRAEQEKNEALEKAMKLKDEFLYLITHEFKTPLAVINSALQTMELVCKELYNEKSSKFLNIIKQNTNRQLRLVNNLLDITRINAGHLKMSKSNVDIVFVTRGIVSSVQTYAAQKGVSLDFIPEESKRILYIDEEKYERILLNLISNALKFTPKGKSIKVLVAMEKCEDRDMVSVSVKDEGIGIPEDKQECIFERFGQADTSLSRQAEGTGMGLYLVKLLVNAFGGTISLQSEVGKGSIFKILLPVTKARKAKEQSGKEYSIHPINHDSRIIHAAEIEFSDIYF